VRSKQVQNPDYQQATHFLISGIEAADTLDFQVGMLMLHQLPAQMQDTVAMRMYQRYISRRGLEKSIMRCFDKGFAEQFILNDNPKAWQYLLEILERAYVPTETVHHVCQAIAPLYQGNKNITRARDSLAQYVLRHVDPSQQRKLIFEQAIGQNALFFDSEADYWGSISVKLDSVPGYQPIVQQFLFRSQDPHALFHLAAMVARLRWQCLQPNEVSAQYAKNLVSAISDYTGMEVEIPNKNGASSSFSPDPIWMLHYGLYWEQHWSDYAWDTRKLRFTHKTESSTESENVELLFQKLSSPNDSIATAAYTALTEADPSAVLQQLPLYTDLIRNPNPAVPPLKKRYLQAAVTLRDWGKEFGLMAQLDPKTEADARALMQQLQVAQRLNLEEKLLKETSLQDLMLLDIWLINQQFSADASFSFSRVLDQLYSQYWPIITENALLTRIFLKKAMVFQAVQTTGTLHQYTRKFDVNNEQQRILLNQLNTDETDADIKNAILQIWANKSKKQDSAHKPTIDRAQSQAFILTQKQPDFNAINGITMHPDFAIELERPWLIKLIKKWPQPKLLENIALNEKLDPETDAQFFDSVFTQPSDFVQIWRWFAPDPKGLVFSHFRSKITALAPEQAGGYLFQFLRNEPTKHWLHLYGSTVKQRHEVLDALVAWYDNQDYLSEYDEGELKLLLLLLEHAEQPLQFKFAVTCAIPSEHQKAVLQRALLASIRYADLETLREFFPCLSEENNDESLGTATLQNLGLPPLFETKNGEPILFNTQLIPSIKLALAQLNVQVYQQNGKIDYSVVQRILEGELITPLINGGGARRDWFVFSVIKILESEHAVSLGFHPKLNEDQSFFTYNSAERAKAWLNYLQSNGLIQAKNRAISWQ
jgi:hypothetical protein